MVININLNFISQIDKLDFELIETLNLVYIYLFIFPLNFVYIIRINKVFSEIVDYLGNYLKGISGIGLVLSI